MSVFEFDHYKEFVRSWVRAQKKRRGQFCKIASFLRSSSTQVSQVFKGDRDLTLEQANELTRFFQFTEIETRYFVAMVSWSRAGTVSLKNYYEKEIQQIRAKMEDLKEHLPHIEILPEQDRAVFYSHWLYCAIANFSTLKKCTLSEIAEHFGIRRDTLTEIMTFLLRTGICIEEEGKIKAGVTRTHLEKESPLVSRHHQNWRLKAIESFDRIDHEKELAFTFPLTCSEKTRKQIKQELINFISRINLLVMESPSEVGCCLNIDWFKY